MSDVLDRMVRVTPRFSWSVFDPRIKIESTTDSPSPTNKISEGYNAKISEIRRQKKNPTSKPAQRWVALNGSDADPDIFSCLRNHRNKSALKGIFLQVPPQAWLL